MDSIRYYLMPMTTLVGVIGFLMGGAWIWLAAGTYIVLMLGDVLLPSDVKPRTRLGAWWFSDLALYLQLPLLIALYAAFLSWYGELTAAGGSITAWQAAACVLGIGWLSVVPTLPIAHELWHRRHWFPRATARFLGTFHLDPAKDVGHNIGHHNLVGQMADADTPRRDQSIYTFVIQARTASWKDTFHHSSQALRRRGLSPWNWRNIGYQQVLMPIALMAICWLAGGIIPATICLAAMIAGNFFMEGLNYMQHYGLIRADDEEIQVQHAWNHLGAVVRPLGCEITNHINHHFDSYIRFDKLEPVPTGPQMPSLFICFLSGLVPPIWFRYIAKPRLRHWDHHFATEKERVLAREANRRAGWEDWLDQTSPQPSEATGA